MRCRLVFCTLIALTIAGPAAGEPLFPRHPVIASERLREGDWQLDIARNRFSQQVVCRLRTSNGRAVYRSGAVGFKFERTWSVADAIYRIDNGPPRASRDDLPLLLALGTPVDRGGMTNAYQGTVWIPAGLVAQADSVIQPRRDRIARRFRYHGFKRLRDLAAERGCEPNSCFVEQ